MFHLFDVALNVIVLRKMATKNKVIEICSQNDETFAINCVYVNRFSGLLTQVHSRNEALNPDRMSVNWK